MGDGDDRPDALAEAADPRTAAARIGMVLALWAERRPDGLAVTSPHGDRTFAGLNGRATQLAAGAPRARCGRRRRRRAHGLEPPGVHRGDVGDPARAGMPGDPGQLAPHR
ncbi:MAG: hypothetical protein U5R31_11520 [Acidimicrobiia bacterium]|nr:hypothetical protein [Acidimicrobiia bacterium]